MHPGAFEFVGRFATLDAVSVIEIEVSGNEHWKDTYGTALKA